MECVNNAKLKRKNVWKESMSYTFLKMNQVQVRPFSFGVQI